jgi:hypothetical protein
MARGRIRVEPVLRPEPDLDLLVRALLQLVEAELAKEEPPEPTTEPEEAEDGVNP